MDDLISKRRKYKNLRDNIKNIIGYLNNAIENLDTPSDKIASYYTIDSISIDKNKLSTARESLINRRNYLENTVLEKIRKEIRELDNEIEGAE